jgi:hypothetical protein
LAGGRCRWTGGDAASQPGQSGWWQSGGVEGRKRRRKRSRAVQGLLLDWRKHFLLPTIFLGTAEKTTTSTELCGQPDVTVTASIDRHVCYGTGPTATVLVYHRYLRSRKGVRKAALPLVKPPSATGLAQSLTRWSATFDTVSRRPGTGKVPDQCSNHRSPRRSPRSKNGSRFSRPEGPGHSNCKELLQSVGPLLAPHQHPLSRLWSISGVFATVRPASAAVQQLSPPASIIRQRTAHRQ